MTTLLVRTLVSRMTQYIGEATEDESEQVAVVGGRRRTVARPR